MNNPVHSRARSIAAAFALLLALPAPAAAQDPAIPPYYQVHGGLFFPGQGEFRRTFGASSDFVWGMGMGLPVSADFFYVIADVSWFKAKGLAAGTPDVTTEFSETFWHAGLLNKYFIATTLAVRLQGGLNFTSAERKTLPAGGTETKTELKRKPGFFGGIGVENQLAGGRMAVFVDAVYDYRRSVEREMPGDFGGVRIAAGLAAYLF